MNTRKDYLGTTGPCLSPPPLRDPVFCTQGCVGFHLTPIISSMHLLYHCTLPKPLTSGILCIFLHLPFTIQPFAGDQCRGERLRDKSGLLTAAQIRKTNKPGIDKVNWKVPPVRGEVQSALAALRRNQEALGPSKMSGGCGRKCRQDEDRDLRRGCSAP